MTLALRAFLLVTLVATVAQGQAAVVNISSPSAVVEGNSGTKTVTFNITCNPCASVNAIVFWSTMDGTATVADNDYVAKSGQIDDFGNGTAVETFSVVVTINGDSNPEANETFTLKVTSASVGCPSLGGPGGCPAAPTTAVGTATIQDDGDVANNPPTAEANGPYPVNEGGSVVLSSGGSMDPDGDSLTFEWDLDNNGSFETSGASPTFSAIDGAASQTVVLRVSDGTASDTDTATVNIANVAPSVNPPIVDIAPSDEGEAVVASADFSDPGVNDTHTCTVDYGEGDGAETGAVAGSTCTGPSHAYGDNGTYTVTVSVTDNDGGSGNNDSEHEVQNVPPTVGTPTFDPTPSDEGEAMTASADFTDAGDDDGPFTCEVDYGDGLETGTVTGMTCDGPSHVYGDDGSFEVTVFVTDKDDGTGSESADAQVNNVPPTVTLDTTGAIAFPGGDAFLGSQGASQDHDADGDDPGSDDLTFGWDFGVSTEATTHFNDTGDPSGSADPFPSADGMFPFSASDTGSVTFPGPGLHLVRIDLEDDDNGTDSAELAKLVTGDRECARSQGFWRHQFRGKGKAHIDTATLQAYLDVVDFASSVFSEQVAAFDPATAEDVFAPSGDKFDKAARQALAAWLNFASGAVAVDEAIDVDGDSLPDMTFLEIVTAIEAILLDPGASRADLVLAKDLAEAVNLLDEGDPACDD